MTDGSNMIDGNHLRSYVERVEKLEAEKADIAALIKDVYAEAKGTGFDPKMIRRVVAMRKQDESKRRAEEEILDLYLAALGM